MSDLYDDKARPFFSRVVDDLRAYDPRLFIRRNLSHGWWELWRWRETRPIPSQPIPAWAIPEQAVKQFEVLEIDHRFVRTLKMNDLAQFDETLDPERVAAGMEKAEEAREAKVDREAENVCMDWASDNARGMQRDLKDVFSGYSP